MEEVYGMDDAVYGVCSSKCHTKEGVSRRWASLNAQKSLRADKTHLSWWREEKDGERGRVHWVTTRRNSGVTLLALFLSFSLLSFSIFFSLVIMNPHS